MAKFGRYNAHVLLTFSSPSFYTLILYPHSIPTSCTLILFFICMILLSSLSGECKESECMKWGRKYEHQFHMRQVQVISQQRVYSLSKSGYIEHLLKSHCDAVDRTHLKIEEYCWAFYAVWLCKCSSIFFLHPHSYSIPTSYTLISLFIFVYPAVKVKNHNT